MLLISCSQTKRPLNRTKAIELYDGPYYRVIRKLRREDNYPSETELFIVSARYGVIHENDEIDFYDLKMNADRAQELRTSNLVVLNELITHGKYSHILINLGHIYLESIRGYEKLIPRYTDVQVCSGQIGERMSQMKNWLLRLKNREIEG